MEPNVGCRDYLKKKHTDTHTHTHTQTHTHTDTHTDTHTPQAKPNQTKPKTRKISVNNLLGHLAGSIGRTCNS